jgi:hypothetical protein
MVGCCLGCTRHEKALTGEDQTGMDAQQFDDLVKRVASTSRRRVLSSRVTGNTAGFVNGGGGVHESGGEVSVADSLIVTLNTAGGLPDNCRPMGAVPNCVG